MFVSSDFLELLQRDEERERGSVADDERWDIIYFVLLYFSCQFLNEKHYNMLLLTLLIKRILPCIELRQNYRCGVLYSVQFSHSVVFDSLRPHESQHARPPCPSPTPGINSNSWPSSRWCHPAISSSVVPFSSCPQPLPASGSFPMSQLFAWDGQSTGVSASASVLPMNTQDWSPLLDE